MWSYDRSFCLWKQNRLLKLGKAFLVSAALLVSCALCKLGNRVLPSFSLQCFSLNMYNSCGNFIFTCKELEINSVSVLKSELPRVEYTIFVGLVYYIAETTVFALYGRCKEDLNLYGGELLLIYAEVRLYKTSVNLLAVCYLT